MPRSLGIAQVTTASFRVCFQAPSGNEDIERFEVMIEGGCIEKGCTLSKSASPLQCEFVGLEPATKYAVNVRACLPNSVGCSSILTGLAITIPAGNMHNLAVSIIWRLEFNNLSVSVLAPANFSFVDIAGNSVGVKLEEPLENNAIKRYEAYIKYGRPEQTCTIKANALRHRNVLWAGCLRMIYPFLILPVSPCDKCSWSSVLRAQCFRKMQKMKKTVLIKGGDEWCILGPPKNWFFIFLRVMPWKSASQHVMSWRRWKTVRIRSYSRRG